MSRDSNANDNSYGNGNMMIGSDRDDDRVANKRLHMGMETSANLVLPLLFLCAIDHRKFQNELQNIFRVVCPGIDGCGTVVEVHHAGGSIFLPGTLNIFCFFAFSWSCILALCLLRFPGHSPQYHYSPRRRPS